MPDEKQPIDQLSQEARIKGAGRITPDNARAEDITPEMMAAVIELLIARKERLRLKWKEVAAAVGMQAPTLSNMVNGHRVPRWQYHIIDLDRWLELEEKRANAPRNAEFILTVVAEEILTVAQVASTLRCIALLHGPSGIGKTMALQAVEAEMPGSVRISVQSASATPLGVLTAIGRRLGIRETRMASQRAIFQRAVEILDGTGRLIIVDEIHKLTGGDDKALHVLRDLFDATGVPMLWCGTTDLVAYLERREAGGREPLSQIRRRIGIARDLTERTRGGDGGRGQPLFTVDEIRRVFARSKMRLTPDAARYLALLANLPDSGGLGTARNLFIMAEKINQQDGGEHLTEKMLRDVHGLLVSRRDFEILAAQIQEQAAMPVHAAAVG